ASVASLQRLRGIGRAKAEAIVAYRRTHGGRPFARADDLTAVRGIGNGIMRRIHTHLTLPPSAKRR
ncbi:MAG TPA: helix-hairpin-helix domain-containing protein, partial [Phycisphaerae bacterium]|nr:helix-hairpin-helix domain-containing protein [Phycisphaerae bacterium]